MKYIFPWQSTKNFFDEIIHVRQVFGSNERYVIVPSKFLYTIVWPQTAIRTTYSNLSLAKNGVDIYLSAQGYYFIEENEVERFKEKLITLL